ncbi:MAG: hypothetical protein JWQ80_48 [Massilia sp.]|nr:hypothetical protein [Massilia sp.]
MNARKQKRAHAAFSRGKTGPSTQHANQEQRLRHLEEAVERLTARDFYNTFGVDGSVFVPGSLTQDRYFKPTSDGWVNVMINGTKTGAASGTKVSLNNSSGGRDAGIFQEGILQGQSFDVASGFLNPSYPRVDELTITVARRPGGGVVIDGQTYDLELKLSYKEGGMAKSSGPFAAKTDPANPTPIGVHDLEIPDFPHDLGLPYGPFGTVWFRIGHSGDRYMHPGRNSAGCITCAPRDWAAIYHVAHSARRSDGKSVGVLNMVQSAALAEAPEAGILSRSLTVLLVTNDPVARHVGLEINTRDKTWLATGPSAASVFTTLRGSYEHIGAGTDMLLVLKKPGTLDRIGDLRGFDADTVRERATGSGIADETGTTFTWKVDKSVDI